MAPCASAGWKSSAMRWQAGHRRRKMRCSRARQAKPSSTPQASAERSLRPCALLSGCANCRELVPDGAPAADRGAERGESSESEKAGVSGPGREEEGQVRGDAVGDDGGVVGGERLVEGRESGERVDAGDDGVDAAEGADVVALLGASATASEKRRQSACMRGSNTPLTSFAGSCRCILRIFLFGIGLVDRRQTRDVDLARTGDAGRRARERLDERLRAATVSLPAVAHARRPNALSSCAP